LPRTNIFGVETRFETTIPHPVPAKVTNLGGAFVVGVFGRHFGLPVEPPSDPLLALMGCLSVLLAMVPLGFTKVEDELSQDEHDHKSFVQFQETRITSPADKKPHLIPPQHSDMGGYLMLDEAVSEPTTPAPTPVFPRREHGRGHGGWCKGLAWSLFAGLAFAFIYIPILPWKHRMALENVEFSSFDYFLSISVGLFIASTAYMLLGGAMKKYQGRKLMKSVLRPALLTGVLWSVASMAQLYSLAVMPYAVAYCLVCGGEVGVSLLWGIFVFKEATTFHNLTCTMLAFLGVLIGVGLVAASK